MNILYSCLGMPSSVIHYNGNGEIGLTYTNGHYTTEIIVTCNFDQHNTCDSAQSPATFGEKVSKRARYVWCTVHEPVWSI